MNSYKSIRSLNYTTILSFFNKLVLFLYAWLLMFDFSRYYDEQHPFVYLCISLFVRLILLVICAFKIVYYFKTNKEYSVFSVLLIFFSVLLHYIKFDFNVNLFFSQFPIMFILAITLVASYKINFEHIAKTYIITILPLLFFRMIYACMGIFPNKILHTGKGDMWTFGLGSHNTPYKWIFYMILCLFYLIRNNSAKIKIIVSIATSFLVVFIYSLTLSTSAALVLIYCCLGYIILTILCAKKSRLSSNLLTIFKYTTVTIPVLSVPVSIVGAIYYNYNIHINGMHKVNTFFNRFRQFSIDCALHGIHLPWEIDEYADQYNGLSFNWFIGDESLSQYNDNYIHYVFIMYGIIVMILFVAMFQTIAIKAFKNNDYYLLLFMSSIIMYGMMEHVLVYIGWNTFLLYPFCNHSDSAHQLDSVRIPLKKRCTQLIIPILLNILVFIYIRFMCHETFAYAWFLTSCLAIMTFIYFYFKQPSDMTQ